MAGFDDSTVIALGPYGYAGRGYSAFRHTRSRALRARELAVFSVSDAVTAFLVRVSPSAFPRQVQNGCFGGQVQSVLHSRKARFTMRSSPE